MRLLLSVFLLLGSTIAHAAAALPAWDTYHAELAKVQTASTPVSLAPLYLSLDALQDALMHIANGAAYIEALSPTELADLQAQTPSLILSQGMDNYAMMNFESLHALAIAHGKPEDIGFFALQIKTRGEDFLPAYLTPRSPTPCVRFGESVMGNLYQAWLDYQQNYPQAYSTFAQQQVADIEEAVSLGTCACGKADSVLSEQNQFLLRFPNSVAVPAVIKRIDQIKLDPEVSPVNCR